MDTDLRTCTWCEDEQFEYGNTIGEDDMCDSCYKGVVRCTESGCDKWTHEDIGCVGDDGYRGDDYYCADHLIEKCDTCGEECEYRQHYSFDEWSDNGYKNTYDRYVCDDCYEEANPSIDPEEVAESMSDNEEEQAEIAEAIKNNIDTKGEIWKKLVEADESEKWEIVKIMGYARARHEDTDYDDLLASGVSRDVAREIIK